MHASDLTLDRERRTGTVRGERIELTKQEFDLLYLLASRSGALFTRASLLEGVWSDDTYVTDRTVDTGGHLALRRARQVFGCVRSE